MYVVQLSTDRFLVNHDGSMLHRVCLVDANGAVVRSNGGPPGSDRMKMNAPRGLAVDKHGNVLVADHFNTRLLVLDRFSAHEMSVPVQGGLQGPYSLCYDESRRRLFIVESQGGRGIVIDNLKDFNLSDP